MSCKICTKKISKYLTNMVINPGCLYKYKGELVFNPLARSVRDYIKENALDFKKLESYYGSDKVVRVDIVKPDSFINNIRNHIIKALKVFKYTWF